MHPWRQPHPPSRSATLPAPRSDGALAEFAEGKRACVGLCGTPRRGARQFAPTPPRRPTPLLLPEGSDDVAGPDDSTAPTPLLFPEGSDDVAGPGDSTAPTPLLFPEGSDDVAGPGDSTAPTPLLFPEGSDDVAGPGDSTAPTPRRTTSKPAARQAG